MQVLESENADLWAERVHQLTVSNILMEEVSTLADMCQKLSKKSMEIMAAAHDEAEGLGHSAVSSEHLLLAFLKSENTGTYKFLKSNGLSYRNVLRMIKQGKPKEMNSSSKGDLEPTSRLKKIMKMAYDETQNQSKSKIEPAHLLISILEEGSEKAASVLSQFDVDSNKTRSYFSMLGKPQKEQKAEVNSSGTEENYTKMIEAKISLSLGNKLEERGSKIHYQVQGVNGPTFDTDMDVLELKDNISVAYEVKGVTQKSQTQGQKKRGKTKELSGPRTLEGADQALIHLAYADVSYLVHPETMFSGKMRRSQILINYLPIGYIIATLDGQFVKLSSPQRSPIDVGKVFNRPRLAYVGSFADTYPSSLKEDYQRLKERYEDLSLTYSEENFRRVQAILDSVCML